MSPWITVLIGGGAAGGTFELIKHWMNLRLYRHTYTKVGLETCWLLHRQ
jgi:hypothetical protein